MCPLLEITAAVGVGGTTLTIQGPVLRGAGIEQKAFEESERAGASGRCDDTEDDDVSTWIGPLLDDERTGEKKCTYYQDRDKEYPFYCSERGCELLQTLMVENAVSLELNKKE